MYIRGLSAEWVLQHGLDHYICVYAIISARALSEGGCLLKDL